MTLWTNERSIRMKASATMVLDADGWSLGKTSALFAGQLVATKLTYAGSTSSVRFCTSHLHLGDAEIDGARFLML